MKKTSLLIWTVFLLSTSVFSQQENETLIDPYQKNNEIKLNAVFLIIGALDVSYERNLNESSSLGISTLIPLDRDDVDLNYYVSPYYRIFFGKKYAAGFFVEGFGMLNSTRIEESFFIDNGNDVVITTNEENYTDFALGVGVGGKWVTKRGIVFELSAGLGRNLFNREEDTFDDYALVGKLGFNIGYRF